MKLHVVPDGFKVCQHYKMGKLIFDLYGKPSFAVLRFYHGAELVTHIYHHQVLVGFQGGADRRSGRLWLADGYDIDDTAIISTGSHVSPSSPHSDGRASESQSAENAEPSGKAESLSGEVPPTRVGGVSRNDYYLSQVSESAPIAKEAVVEHPWEANPSALQIHL